MAIADTSFFVNYQDGLGVIYAKSLQEVLNPVYNYTSMVNTRQSFLFNLAPNEVSAGVSVIEGHLSSESSFIEENANSISAVLSSVNTFFRNTYSYYLRDYFTGLTSSRVVAWANAFKDAWEVTFSAELVHQIGIVTWNGNNFVFYPPTSSVTNKQYSAEIIGINSNYVTLSGFGTDITHFALPGYYFVNSATSSMPGSNSYAFSTTVVGIYNTNTLILSNQIGSGSSCFVYRPLKNAEYLEFRFGTTAITGVAATSVTDNLYLSVTLNNTTGLTTATVGILTSNNDGRINIGTYGNSSYLALGITSVGIATGSSGYLINNPTLEVWVKSTN